MKDHVPFRTRWLSRRAFVLHALLVVEVPLCLLAGWWQANVALSGNTLSYFYAVEWPAFAGLGVYTWWHLMHMPPDEPVFARSKAADTRPGGVGTADRRAPVPSYEVHWDPEAESPALRSYNAYLAEIHASGRRRKWRRPRPALWSRLVMR